MKKIFFLSMAALAVVSCSNDYEETLTERKLVKATMTAETPETLTRAYLGHIDTDSQGRKQIGVKFETGDKIDVYEFVSYAGGTKYEFTNLEEGDYQSANLTGLWTEDLKAWAAIFPSSPNNKMVSMSNGKAGGNVYQFVIPQSQKTVEGPDGGVTYENAPNVMLAAQYFKDDYLTPTCFLAPVVAYLYFGSENEHVDVTSLAGQICGNVKCVTSKNAWNNWVDFDACATITGLDNNDASKVIHSTGVYTERSGKFEHVVCLLPGTFAAGKLKVGSMVNTADHELARVNMYYLGNIDSASN